MRERNFGFIDKRLLLYNAVIKATVLIIANAVGDFIVLRRKSIGTEVFPSF